MGGIVSFHQLSTREGDLARERAEGAALGRFAEHNLERLSRDDVRLRGRIVVAAYLELVRRERLERD